MPELQHIKSALPPAVFVIVALGTLVLAWADFDRLGSVVGSAGAGAPPAAGPADEVSVPGPRVATEGLAELALFGSPGDPAAATPVPPPPPAPDDMALPESAAAFQLFGVIESSAGEQARVILGATEADQREYRVGEQAPDGALIHAVRARAVVLERDGQLEEMKLPEPTSGAASARVGGRFMPRRLPGNAALRVNGLPQPPQPQMSMPDDVPPGPPPVDEVPPEEVTDEY